MEETECLNGYIKQHLVHHRGKYVRKYCALTCPLCCRVLYIINLLFILTLYRIACCKAHALFFYIPLLYIYPRLYRTYFKLPRCVYITCTVQCLAKIFSPLKNHQVHLNHHTHTNYSSQYSYCKPICT